MKQNSFRKHLSMPGMLREVREYFDSVPDPVASRGLTLSDCLMTELAVFSLKMTSMLSFDEKIRLDESSVPAQNFNLDSAVRAKQNLSRLLMLNR